MNNPKFRVYDKKKKEWLLGYKELGGFSLVGEIMLFEEWSNVLKERMEWLNELDIMQSTGLFDENGKEIFEGDVLNFKRGNWNKGIYCVFWEEQYAGFNPFCDYSDEYSVWHYPKDCEIIGNIWDNQELLNK